MADEDVVMVGTPTVSEIKVSATVVDHVKGPKVTSFKYRPKKRIRVKGGHRHFYTRLMIDFIGKPGEERKVEVKKEAVVAAEVETVEAAEEPKVEKQKKASTKDAAKKPAATKSAPKSSTTKKTEKK
jgi:ribosomal protein L21